MVKYRDPLMIIILTIITLGIYAIYWLVSTTNELRRLGTSAPDPWALLLLFVPLVNIFVGFWYYWRYSEALEKISGFSTVLMFILFLIIWPVAMVLTQLELNKKAQASSQA